MNFVEHPVLFDCEGERLVGIVVVPETAVQVAVLVIVGGPQYRAGSHRQFVRLTRALAAGGFPAMRFDYRGMGDSTGAARTFEECGPDIAAAIEALRANCPSVQRIVLWGLCDAASAALAFWQQDRDASIAGMVLLNPWVRSESTLAKAHIKHYYGRRFLQKEFWSKLASGRIDPLASLRTFARNLRTSLAPPSRAASRGVMTFQDRMASALRSFSGPILLILSGDDLTAREFLEYAHSDPGWHGVMQGERIERRDVARADHTFSSADAAQEVESRTLAWLHASVLGAVR